MEITVDDFTKLDLRVGEIISAEKPEWSEKLIKMQVDFGPSPLSEAEISIKQVFSGIAKWYNPEDLVGKQAVFLVNLPPRIIHEETSEAMILTAENTETESYSIVQPQNQATNGCRVC